MLHAPERAPLRLYAMLLSLSATALGIPQVGGKTKKKKSHEKSETGSKSHRK